MPPRIDRASSGGHSAEGCNDDVFVWTNLVIWIAQVLSGILTLYFWIVIAAAIMSWIEPNPYNPIVRTLRETTLADLLVGNEAQALAANGNGASSATSTTTSIPTAPVPAPSPLPSIPA